MAAEPRLWILSRGRKGDLDQMLALASALGWPHEVKTLRFAGPEIPVLSTILLRGRLSSPWPDLVLCAEASPSMIARDVKRRSGAKTRIVCLGRPAGSAENFDLVITTAQYRIPAAPNVVELSMPLAARREAKTSASPDGPIALLVGGPAFPDRLGAMEAQNLAADAIAYAAQKGKPLHVLTSPRTPTTAIAALENAIAAPHRLDVFGRGENRYQQLLGSASEIIVTSDSVSMVADALASGKPAAIYPLPQTHDLTWRLGEWLYGNAVESRKPLFAPLKALFDSGLIEAAADRRRLFARLVREKRLSWFGEPLVPPQPEAAGLDLARAVETLRALMA
jgi:mitochondrial fission protein ELM1